MSWTVELNEIPPPFFAENVMFGGLLFVLIPHVYSSRSSSSLVRWERGNIQTGIRVCRTSQFISNRIGGKIGEAVSTTGRPTESCWPNTMQKGKTLVGSEAMRAWAYRWTSPLEASSM